MSGEEHSPARAYATALVSGMLAESAALSGLEHDLTKGILRELLLRRLFCHLLPDTLGATSGIVVNWHTEQSKQTDIIIFDRRITGPVIKAQSLGVVPAESVVGVVEVKSRLGRQDIIDSEEAAAVLYDRVCGPLKCVPRVGLFGFYGRGAKELSGDTDTAKDFLTTKAPHLKYITLVGRFSWANLPPNGWRRVPGCNWPDEKVKKALHMHEEVKSFAAIFLDNCRTEADLRWRMFSQEHRDWLSLYIREQDLCDLAVERGPLGYTITGGRGSVTE